MKSFIFNITQKAFEKINIGIVPLEELKVLRENQSILKQRAEEYQILREIRRDQNEILNFSKDQISNIISLREKSPSQLKQDLFVLYHLNFKRAGFFVEFGATNGIHFSNSFLLEKEFGWDGILAEPAKCWHEDLKKNRNCHIETDCVWTESGKTLSFNEAEMSGLSTIDEFSNSDRHEKNRKNGIKYDVNSISLMDLLDKYNAPKTIDYLSIDTEGSEYEMLSNFDFSKYSFNVITCEHNKTDNRKKIFRLLKKNGYQRKFPGFSKWDDWYVKV